MNTAHAMRRADRQITDPERIESLIRRGRFITLALVDGIEPYSVTLSYGFDASASRLYFHVAQQGHKLDVIAANPRACGSIVLDGGYQQGECEHPFESVVLRGSLRLVQDAKEKRQAIHVLVEHLESDADEYWASRTWSLDDRIGGFVALAFEIESATAKQGR